MGFCPPLVITSAQIDELFDKFELAMAATLEWANGEGLLAA
jgi:4-aminobutyrate--pyruvate transaminase